MHLRQTHGHRTYTLRGKGKCRCFGNAWNTVSGTGDIILRRHTSGREKSHARCHDERFVRATEHASHRLDRSFVDLAILCELRKVMDEGEVDDAACVCRATLQALYILKRAAMNLGAQSLECIDVGSGAREAHNLMPIRDQFPCCHRADEPGSAGHEHTHADYSSD
jgi:hypothetical protein